MAPSDRVDASEPYSPGWWLEALGRKLWGRYARIETLDRYYRGDPPLPEGAANARDSYRAFQARARSNYAELIVEAVRQRMRPVGFRTGAAGDDNGDRAARDLWNANDLDVESADIHRMMLALSVGYAIVGLDDDGAPVITAEDPRQVVTEHDPRLPRRVLAAVKVFRDEVANTDYAYLYLPGEVWCAARQTQQVQAVLAGGFRARDWQWVHMNPLPEQAQGTVPVVRFENARGMGEFEMHLDHLDRINFMLLQRMVIATMQAFRQRAIQGDLPEVDAQGNPIDYNELFVADPGALWQLPEGTNIWESGQVDLAPILQSVKDDVQQLAAVTFTPQHYLMPESSGRSGGSAEGAQLSREGLVFKTEDRIARANVGWKQVMSLAFRFQGDETRADLAALEPIWAPAERLTLSERADAASKAMDVPWRTKMSDIWGFDPEQVDRMENERGADLFAQAVLALGQPQQPQQPQQQAPQPAQAASQ